MGKSIHRNRSLRRAKERFEVVFGGHPRTHSNSLVPGVRTRKIDYFQNNLLGEGVQGAVHRVELSIVKLGRHRRRVMAVKTFRFKGDAISSYYKLLFLRTLGFPTVPFPTLFAKDKKLMMKDLTEGGKKQLFEVKDLWPRFWRHLKSNGVQTNDLAPLLSDQQYEHAWEAALPAELANRKELFREYCSIQALAKKNNVRLSETALFIVVDNGSKKGKLILADVVESYPDDNEFINFLKTQSLPFAHFFELSKYYPLNGLWDFMLKKIVYPVINP